MPISSGHVIWLFGLSGAGKSTLAAALADTLRQRGFAVLALDGDRLRAGLCAGLGYTHADRAENLRRAAEVARLAADSGLCVIASFITPLEAHRRLVRGIIGGDRLSLVHAAAPLEVCRARDVKGLYAGARDGAVAQMTGLTSAFEPPTRADLTLETDIETPAASAQKLLEYALAQLARA